MSSSIEVDPAKNGLHVGRSVERVEDAALLRGRGRFADDLGVRPGTLHAAILRSPHAHARIVRIDASAALSLSGVRAIITNEDVRTWSAPFVVSVKQPMEHWCLAMDKVRYVGEPVAVIVAKDRYIAEDALDLIQVDYETLPVVVDAVEAAAAGAPVLHDAVGTNVVSDRNFHYGEPDVQFARAPHCVSLNVRYPRNSCTPIECGVVVSEFLSGAEGYEVLSNFMGPFSLAAVMALALKVPASKLRLKSPRDSGGSFGVKQSLFPYVVLMCLASRKAGSPVKWVEDRLEHLVAATSATGRSSTIEAAVETDGRIIALRYDQIDDCGAYLRAPEPATLYRMHGCLTGAYGVRHLSVRNRVVLTNKTPTGLVRGFGGPQVYFQLERLVQRIAVELQLDPLHVYRRNLIPAGSFPYSAPAGALIDSGDYQAALELAVREGRLAELVARRDQARMEGRLYGIGYAAIVEPSISNMGYVSMAMTPDSRAKAGPKNGALASATVSIDLLGGVNVVIASNPQGQGHMTVCAQLVADIFGLTPQDITVNVDFDSHKDAWSTAAGNYSSRFAGAVAGTVHLAATKLRDKLARIAATQLQCDAIEVVFATGRIFTRQAPEKSQPFARLASGPHWAPALLPAGETLGLRETVFWSAGQLAAPDAQDRINTSAAYGFVFDICAVEIDRNTGAVRIDRYVTTHDAGTLLNPALADGQIRGGYAQGLGAALMEEFHYGDDGAFLSGTFADYLVPTAMEVPEPLILHLQTPSPFTPLGSKGLGEGNNMSTPACMANAIADALGSDVDVEAIVLPLTPAKLLALIGTCEPARSGAAVKPATKALRGGQALAMSGSVDLAASPEAVYRVLLDPAALARVIPGCHELKCVGTNRYSADVTLGVGLVKARYLAEIELSELDPPRSLRLAGKGLGALGAAEGSGRVTLEASDLGIRGPGTRLTYDYGIGVSGKVAAVGARMLEGGAKIVLNQLFEQLGRQASGKTVPVSGLSWWHKLLVLCGLRS